jgi:hypothetical protein
VKIISLDNMRDIAAELERVAAPATSSHARAQVLAWAMQYAGAYYRTARGELRRVFPKGRAAEHFRAYEKEKAHAAG